MVQAFRRTPQPNLAADLMLKPSHLPEPSLNPCQNLKPTLEHTPESKPETGSCSRTNDGTQLWELNSGICESVRFHLESGKGSSWVQQKMLLGVHSLTQLSPFSRVHGDNENHRFLGISNFYQNRRDLKSIVSLDAATMTI